ncbi:hypothetical protein NL676_026816 [Syzygium grande]|nr:hypothetical protein NL676_026816 [Syzygium grande]
MSTLSAASTRCELLLNRAAAVAPADAAARHPLLSACALVAPLLVSPNIDDYPERHTLEAQKEDRSPKSRSS